MGNAPLHATTTTAADPQTATQSQPAVQQLPGAHQTAVDGGRVVVVQVSQQPQPSSRRRDVAADVEVTSAAVASVLQALGGLLITVLSIQKLWEELRLLRALGRSARLGGGGGGSGGAASDAPDPAAPGAGGRPGTRTAPAATSRGLLAPPPGLPPGLGLGGATAEAAAGDEAAAPPAGWGSVSGLEHIKMALQEATVLPMLRPDVFRGVRRAPRGVLLFGPPGTGKTLLARAVAAESGATLVAVTAGGALSKWFGESEANIRRLFEAARRSAPSIIFLDEADSLFARRGDGASGASEASRRVTNELLSFMDGIQSTDDPVVVLAATNAPWDIDEAALSRFGLRLLVPLPGACTRAAIMRGAMHGVATSLSAADWRTAAERADRYSGRDLMQVCREAAMRPLRACWGDRLLEGSAAGASRARQRRALVDSAAAALRRGRSRRAVRRELAAWQRSNRLEGLQVEAVLAEAVAAVQGGGGGGGGAAERQSAAAARVVAAPGEVGGALAGSAAPLAPAARGGAGTSARGPGVASHPIAAEDADWGEALSADEGASSASPSSTVCVVAAGADGAAGSGGAAAPSKQLHGSWTLEDLVTLPVDAVRPVSLEDLEWALRHVAPTDAEQAPRFEEWGRQHGTGAAKRDAAFPFLSMYS